MMTCKLFDPWRWALAAAVVALAAAPLTADAHGQVHELIAAVDVEIERHPGRADLFLKRGRLHLEERHHAEARADFTRVLALDPRQRGAHYFLAQALLALGDAPAAEAAAGAFLAALAPDEGAAIARAHQLLGDVHLRAGRSLEAARAFESALSHVTVGQPSDYLRPAQAYRAVGPGHLSDALRVLDSGIARLGPLAALVDVAIEVELERGGVAEALGRLDRQIALGQRLEVLHFRRGEILAAAGEGAQARESFEIARRLVRAMSPQRRSRPAVAALEAQLGKVLDVERR